MIYKNKKGQNASTTISWFFATIVIFFILALFIFVTIIMVSSKNLTVVDIVSKNGKNELTLDGTVKKSPDFLLSSQLTSVLNKNIEYKDGSVRVTDLISYYHYSRDEEIYNLFESTLKNEFDTLYNGCYKVCLAFFSKPSLGKEIDGGKCSTTSSNSCNSLDNRDLGEDLNMGEYERKSENENYEIKIYVGNENE